MWCGTGFSMCWMIPLIHITMTMTIITTSYGRMVITMFHSLCMIRIQVMTINDGALG